MALGTIQFNGSPLQVVKLPGEDLTKRQRGLWFRSVEFSMEDKISAPKSPYASKSQRFEFPGAEEFYGMCELPVMTMQQAAKWRAFLGQCRGILRPFLLGDPLHEAPLGRIDGKSNAVCDNGAGGVAANLPMSKYLQIRGLVPNAAGLLLAGDYVQVNYRLHMLVDDLPKTDATGRAAAELWPSIREQPADGLKIVTNKPRGLFCLATNKRTWSGDYKRLQSMSVPVMEWLGS